MRHFTGNRVLDSLAPDDRHRVRARCDRTQLVGGSILARAGENQSVVYFPLSAVISVVSTFRDGTTIEMANIGREACTGMALLLGHPRQLSTSLVQVAGPALALEAQDFDTLRAELPAFERVLLSAAQAAFYQVMVSGACNGVHDARQRLARWLLTMDDRSDGDVLNLTQDFLAQMLGVRRATVSNAASEMQEEGSIDYARGRLRIRDHARLRRASCECYDLVRDAYDTLLPLRQTA